MVFRSLFNFSIQRRISRRLLWSAVDRRSVSARRSSPRMPSIIRLDDDLRLGVAGEEVDDFCSVLWAIGQLWRSREWRLPVRMISLRRRVIVQKPFVARSSPFSGYMHDHLS